MATVDFMMASLDTDRIANDRAFSRLRRRLFAFQMRPGLRV
jgi:hypothetical protein